MPKKSPLPVITDLSPDALANKTVLVRADLDVPLTKDGTVADNYRLRRALPTINYLVKNQAKTVLIGHLDRPGGRVVEELRMDPVAEELSRLLNDQEVLVYKIDDCLGTAVQQTVQEMEPGEIVLLENLKFHTGEPENSKEFARQLATLADMYVNDCFSTSHHQYASITKIPQFIHSYAGNHLIKELKMLNKARKNPKRPVIAIIGGAKVESKSKAIQELTPLVDHILLGGKLMFEKSLEKNPKVIFPKDYVGAYDIGPQTAQDYIEGLKHAGTIIWGGPLGKFENPTYQQGTKTIAQAVADSSAYTIVGGGDTISALNKFNLLKSIDWVCSGGGAMLEYMGKGTLAGIEALKQRL